VSQEVISPSTEAKPNPGAVVGAIAAYLGAEKGGGRAIASELRRLGPSELYGSGFWLIAVRHLEPLLPTGPWREEGERRWSTILQCMASLVGLHDPKVRLGRALALAEVSEARLLQLLRARGEALVPRLRACTHLLSSRGQRVDQLDIARLVLSEDRPNEESVRRDIARDFYANSVDK
jgi:CRISPR type I-E-associated protein CasB/Cse2